jgi:unsaturated chondroitin disaccharide hydrolase
LLVAVIPLITGSAGAMRSRAAGVAGPAARTAFGCATVASDLRVALAHLGTTTATVSPHEYPVRSGADGTWETTGPEEWTSGFLPGALWLAYQRTGDPRLRRQADLREAGIEPQKTNTTTHDLGFMIGGSCGLGARLTGDRHDADVVRTAAD